MNLTGGGLAAASVDNELHAVASTGAKWVRVDFNWPTLAPTRNTRNWRPADHLVQVANSLGLHLLGEITSTPAWEGTLPNPTDFGNWAGELAGRYGPQGVHAWEIWNEANLKGPWHGAPNPVLYTALLKSAYTAIHAADADPTVVTSGMSPAADTAGYSLSPYTFLKDLYDNGAKGYFDAVGLHITQTPFAINCATCNQTWNQSYAAQTQMYPLMQQMGDGYKKIWATEAGYSTTTNTSKGVSEAQQGPLLIQLLDAWLHKPYAGPVFVYSVRDQGTDTSNWFDMMGLLRHNYTPKPAYGQFASYAKA
jgi:hypothetical protein